MFATIELFEIHSRKNQSINHFSVKAENCNIYNNVFFTPQPPYESKWCSDSITRNDDLYIEAQCAVEFIDVCLNYDAEKHILSLFVCSAKINKNKNVTRPYGNMHILFI